MVLTHTRGIDAHNNLKTYTAVPEHSSILSCHFAVLFLRVFSDRTKRMETRPRFSKVGLSIEPITGANPVCFRTNKFILCDEIHAKKNDQPSSKKRTKKSKYTPPSRLFARLFMCSPNCLQHMQCLLVAAHHDHHDKPPG